jgi:hypothetical protein
LLVYLTRGISLKEGEESSNEQYWKQNEDMDGQDEHWTRLIKPEIAVDLCCLLTELSGEIIYLISLYFIFLPCKLRIKIE